MKPFLADRTIGRAFGTVCRLSATFCTVAKRYVLAKNCLNEQIVLPPETMPQYRFRPPIPTLTRISAYKEL